LTQIKTLRDEELQADINPEAALRSDGNSGTHCMLDVHFIGVALCELSKLLRNVREHSPEPACSDSSAVDPRRTAVFTAPVGVTAGDNVSRYPQSDVARRSQQVSATDITNTAAISSPNVTHVTFDTAGLSREGDEMVFGGFDSHDGDHFFSDDTAFHTSSTMTQVDDAPAPDFW
jgi:hypothetical protein